MKKEQCFELGHIVKPHGLEGEVLVFLDVDDAEYYVDLEAVFLDKNQLVPYIVEDIVIKGTKVIFKFEGIENPEEAAELSGIKMFLPVEALPPLQNDQYYFHELINFEVEDKTSGKIGLVKEIYNLPHQDLLGVEHPKGEVLVPINEHIIKKVDKSNKHIFVELPEGLLEIYIDEQE